MGTVQRLSELFPYNDKIIKNTLGYFYIRTYKKLCRHLSTKLAKMQKMGLEPTRYCYHRHLKPARLPIPPLLLGTLIILHDILYSVKFFLFFLLQKIQINISNFCIFFLFLFIDIFGTKWYYIQVVRNDECANAEVSELADEQD